MTTQDFTHPPIVSSDEWLVARETLLAHEKELTKHYDQVSAERRRLPMVKVEKHILLTVGNVPGIQHLTPISIKTSKLQLMVVKGMA